MLASNCGGGGGPARHPPRPFSAGQGLLFSQPLSDQELLARGLLASSSARRTPRPPSREVAAAGESKDRRPLFRSSVHHTGVFSQTLPDVAFSALCDQAGCRVHSSLDMPAGHNEFLQRKFDSFRPFIGEGKRNRVQRRFNRTRLHEGDVAQTDVRKNTDTTTGAPAVVSERDAPPVSARGQYAGKRGTDAPNTSRQPKEPRPRPFVTVAHPPHTDLGIFLLDRGDAKAAFRRGTHEAESDIRHAAQRQSLVQQRLYELFVRRVRRSVAGERSTSDKFVKEKIEAARHAQASPTTGVAPHSHKCNDCGHRFVYM